MTLPLIGLSGYGRVGKDAAAAAIVELGWHLGKFSQPMKDVAYAADPPIVQNGITYSYARLVDAFGIERVKDDYPASRVFQQRLGKAGRDVLGEDVWVNAALARIPHDSTGAVFVDCRFPNEADAIRESGGIVLRIERPGYGPVAGPDGEVHISETALDDYAFDVVVENSSDLHTLRSTVRALATAYLDARLTRRR